MQESKYEYRDMLRAAVSNANEARKNAGREHDAYIVLDIGPIGQLLEPMGIFLRLMRPDIVLSRR